MGIGECSSWDNVMTSEIVLNLGIQSFREKLQQISRNENS